MIKFTSKFGDEIHICEFDHMFLNFCICFDPLLFECPGRGGFCGVFTLQGYLSHEKHPPP